MPSRRFYIGLAVSAIFIVLLLRQVDRGELGSALSDVRPLWLLAAAPPYVFALWWRAVRWRLVLRPALVISTWDALALDIIGASANNVLPARAGEVARAGLLRQRHGATWSLGLGTIAVERIVDGVVLSAFLGVTLVVAGGGAVLAGLALGLGAASGAALIALLLLAEREAWALARAAALVRRMPARWRPRLERWLSGSLDGLTTVRGGGPRAAVAAATAASWAVEGVAYWLVGLAFGLDLNPLLFAGVLAAANLAFAAPSTAGGIGPFEYFATEAVVAHGVTPAAGAAYAIGVHAFTVVPVVIVGLVLLWRRHLGLRALAHPGEAEPESDDGRRTAEA